jgi:hypothetical protein
VIATALYAGYLVWLLCGLADFILHRRTDLVHTSGVRESALHLVQLALVGSCLALGLILALTPASLSLIGLLVAVHAFVGYLDTRSAYGLRKIGPLEQHIHSVLDMAPVMGLVLAAIFLADFSDGGFHERQPAAGFGVWCLIILPALLLCGLPALTEFRDAMCSRRERRSVQPCGLPQQTTESGPRHKVRRQESDTRASRPGFPGVPPRE